MNQLPRLATIPYHVRPATPGDVDACQRIARKHNKALPFVRRDSLQHAIRQGSLLVADRGGEVVGFVRWHLRRDGWNTVHEIAVDKRYQSIGIGRALLYAVPCPIRLKCPFDLPSNAFYKSAGLQLVGVEKGRNRDLNVWEMKVLAILCAGDNKRYAEIARQTRMAYGVRHDCPPKAWPYMLDINWCDYSWQDYRRKCRAWQPVMAMVPDYEYPEQRERMLAQVEHLRQIGIMRILVCPKFDGAVADIPKDCIVAVSVPSRYAGYLPAFCDLAGRRVHLLGGTPQQQIGLIPKLIGHGAKVLSVDGNSHTAAAQRGSTYIEGKWRRRSAAQEPADFYGSVVASGRNIQREMQIGAAQLPLFTF